MNGRLRSVIGFALALTIILSSVPAFALPNGMELMTSANISYSSGSGATNDGFFTVKAYNAPYGGTLVDVGSSLSRDSTGTYVFITNETIRESYRYEIKAAAGLGSFVLMDITMGEVGTPEANFSGVTVEGYQGTTLVCSTTPYNSYNGVSENKFPINFAPFAGVRIDSFRINYVKEIGTYASTFNLASFTMADASASTPVASDTRLQSGSIKGQAVSSLGTAAATPQSAAAGTVTITRAQSVDTTGTSPYVTQFAPAAAGATVKVVKYASGASFTNFATDSAYAGQAVSSGDRFVVRVTSQDATMVRYYVINVTVTAEALASAAVLVPAPTAGGTPANAADATGGANFAVTALNWNGTMTAGEKFKAGTSYTATLTLTANAGYIFPAGFTNVTAAGSSSVDSFSVNGTGSGNSVTCSVTFPATVAPSVTAIEITGQPKLTYKDGNALDLSGMVVTQTYNDASVGTVTFTGGTAAGYTAVPAHGSTLSQAVHNGQPVTVTYTGVTPNLTVQTGSLSVAPLGTAATLLNASVKGVAVASLGTPGASPEEAVPGSVTITRAQGADETGTAPYLTAFVPTDLNASVKAVKYASGASHANFASDAAYADQAVSDGDRFMIRVTSEDGATVNWYAADVTVPLEEIGSVSLTITAPAAGEAPQSAADITEDGSYTVSSLTCNGALTSDGYFKAGTAYTASLSLTANAGCTFPNDFTNVSVPSAASVGGMVLGTGGGNSLTLTLSFDETEALAVAAIEVTTQPMLAYKEGNALDLTGMAVRRIYNDWTEDTVTFTDGTAADFSTDPAHGAVLNHDNHDGLPVAVTYTGVTSPLTAYTDDLAVAALSGNASLLEARIKGQAAATLGAPGASPDAALAGSVSVTRVQAADNTGTTPYITLFTPTDGFALVKAVKYASGASHANFASDAPYAGEAVSSGDRFVVRVTAENGMNVSWYQIEATVLLDQIAAASVTFPVPTAGSTPANAADAAGGEGFTVTGLTWNGAMTADGKFKAGTAYTASLTLTSGTGYTFPAAFANVTAIGASSVGSYLTLGAGSGNNVSCVVSFPATSALYVTAIEVTGQPRLSYKHGNALDLSGMAVTQTYNDFTQDTVTFTGGMVANYTTEPAGGTILSHALNDGQPVLITYTGVTPHLTAQTDNLQVAPLGTVATLSAANLKGVAAASLGTPGASPDDALPGSVTLTRVQGANITGTAPYATWFTPTDGFASVRAVKYAAGASHANFVTDAAYAGQAVTDGDRFVIRVTAEDGVTEGWYQMEATVLLEEITTASITITAPAAGAAPQSAADIPGGGGYTVTGLVWNEALTPGGKFMAGTAYSVALTLTAKPGYTFPAGFAGVTAAGSSSVGSYSVNGTGSGNSAGCVVSFPATAAPYVTAIEVTSQPKLSYKDGYTLELTGMAVRQTYNDFTQETVTFTDGTAAGYTAGPSNGSTLSRAVHDGLPVTVTYTGVTPNLTAQTDDLAVAALNTDASLASAVIKGQSAAGFAMASSPEAAAETAVTLTYTAAMDTAGLMPYETAFTASDAFAAVKVVKYASGASYGSFAADQTYAGQAVSSGDQFVVRVTAEDKVTVRYCVFAVTIQYSELTAVTVSITAPVAGGSPQSAADTLGGTGFAVTGLDWNGMLTAGGEFKAGTAYTANLTLTAGAGYTFPAGFTGAAVSGAMSVDTYAVIGTGSGNSASCVVAFPETAALATALLTVDTQPAKLEYREGDALDLSGLKIKRTYNDRTEDTVAFLGGTAAGFEVSPANGTILIRSIHNGNGVKITETVSGCFAYTAALSVLPPLVPDTQIQETTASGMTVVAEGSFSDGAQLVVTPIGEVDSGYEALSDYMDGRQALSAFEVRIVPEGFYEMPVTLSFAVDSAYNGYTLYIYHRLQSGSVEQFTPTVQNGLAVITVTSLSPFLLAVDPAVQITAQPQDATVYVGQAASFTVAAQGVMPLAYQWQNRANGAQSWQDIPLAAEASHLTGAANLSHDGSQYRVKITDGLGRSVYSDTATLTVLKKAGPDTGDHSHPALYALMTVFLAAGASLLLKKRRKA